MIAKPKTKSEKLYLDIIILEAFTCFVNIFHAYIISLQLVTMKFLTQNSNALKGNNFFPHGNINKPYHETKLDPKSCNK
jgi:hypothetical protein